MWLYINKNMFLMFNLSFSAKFFRICFSILFILFSAKCLAGIDTIRMTETSNPSSMKAFYKSSILVGALEATQDKYGPFSITTSANRSSIERAILEVHSGKNINTFMAVTTNEWEKNTLPIRIPIRRGILNYRLLTINKAYQKRFTNITSIDDLKKLRIGVRSGWAITPILKESGFNVIESHSFDGLFYMLADDRIDFIPRGINEIHAEIEERSEAITNLTVEPNIVLFVPSPYYIFVSPKEPKLAERLKEGLHTMKNNGDLLSIFNQYYADIIAQANLDKRTMFSLSSPNLPLSTPLEDKSLWFYYDKKHL